VNIVNSILGRFFKRSAIIAMAIVFHYSAIAQKTDTLPAATLENCVRYAIEQNPNLKNARINELITEAIIKQRLADWLPQVGFTYNLQHNFNLPTNYFNGQYTSTGVENTSGLFFGGTQTIFNRDVLLVTRSGKDVRLQARQATKAQDINIVVLVSKAFYDVLLTLQQIKISDDDIARISESLEIAFYQYRAGTTDKTDYKRATISLNNAQAQRKNNTEQLNSKYAFLKQLMNYPIDKPLDLVYDSAQMSREIFIDTLQPVNYTNRIEVQLLETFRRLQQYNLKYYRWGFLPNVSAFGNYNLNFLNNNFSKLYTQNFPSSNTGLLLTVPIFQGGKRLYQVRQARLQLSEVDNSLVSLKDSVNTQYQQAISSYKTNLYNYRSQQENVNLATEVYDVITLQYKAGIKPYIEVINAETDLRNARINMYNALYQVLSSKIDVQRALGIIVY
jgi:outer membrane protein